MKRFRTQLIICFMICNNMCSYTNLFCLNTGGGITHRGGEWYIRAGLCERARLAFFFCRHEENTWMSYEATIITINSLQAGSADLGRS